MKIFLLFLSLVFAASLVGYAQMETLLTEGVEKKIEVKYQSNNRGDMSNMIVEKVASAKVLPIHAVSLVYNVKEYREIIKQGTKLHLKLSIGNYVFDDDVNYKQFSINKYLTPSLISYTYVWSDSNDKVIESNTFEKERFKNGAFLLNKKVNVSVDKSSYKLYMSDVSFGFSNNDVKKLDEFMSTVDAYYDTDAQLNMIEQEMGEIRIDSIEMLEEYRQQVLDNIKVFNQIRFSRYTSKLSLNANDPIQFKSHFGRAEVRNRELKKELENTLNNMHITYYLKGVDWLNWGDVQKAKLYFNKSISEKSDYASPYYELAKIDFDNKLYDRAIDSCSMILNTLKPDTDIRYNSVKLAESVIYVYLDEINIFIDEINYSKALEMLSVCKNYSTSIPGVKVFSEFEDIQGRLFQAYYNDLASVTQLQIERKQLQQAQFNVDSLIGFRISHKNYIQSPEKEHVLLNDLYGAWIEDGKYYLEKNITDSSLYAFVQASNLCRKHDVVYCTDELTSLIHTVRVNKYEYMVSQCDTLIIEQLVDSALISLNVAEKFREQNSLERNAKVDILFLQAQQIKYSQYIAIGYQSYLGSQSREALAFYDQALVIEKSYKIVVDTSLISKTKMAARGYITLLCLQGETLVEALHINDAKQKLSGSENLFTYYNMDGDEESIVAINNLKSKLRVGECDEIQHLYNIQVLSAKKFIEKREFIYASNALDKAEGISTSNNKCNLIDLETKKIADEISSMLYYEKQMVEINDELKSKEYSNTIEDYKRLTGFYHDSCENNFGIVHDDLFTYIATNTHKGLVDFGVRYYIQLEKTDTALILLNILHAKGYIVAWSKQSQVQLGVKLARDDIESDSKQDPKRKVLIYTKGDKWYRYLNKAYLNEWKSM